MLARERIVVAVMRTRNTGGDIVTAPATAVLASARMRGDVQPYLADADCVLYHGDVLEVLRELPDESVDCAATSPPFFGLRDYQTGRWEGGDEGCDHVKRERRPGMTDGPAPGYREEFRTGAGSLDQQEFYGDTCGKCGARRIDQQIGLEATPEEWRDRLVEVFRELRRVLVPTGTLWCEVGDGYTDKQLQGSPFLLAFGLRDDGWWWRSTSIWHKPNCLPESVRDRPVVSHSYVFQFAKGQWKSRVVQLANLPSQFFHLGDDLGAEGPYVWTCDLSVRLATAISNSAQFQNEFSLAPLDSEVWQQGSYDDDSRSPGGLPVEHRPAVLAARFLNANLPAKEFLSELYRLGVALSDSYHLVIGGGLAEFPLPPGVTPYGKTAIRIEHPGEIRKFDLAHGTIVEERPVRCSYFHDAEAVREPAEWARWGDQTVVKEQQGKGGWIKPNSKEYLTQGRTTNGPRSTENREQTPGFEQRLVAADGTKSLRSVWTIPTEGFPEAHFATWPTKLAERIIRMACPENGTILDPFVGSGTTCHVARKLGRRSVGIDLNSDYLDLAARRLQQQSLFAVTD